MEGYSRKEEKCNRLFDLIPKEAEWLLKRERTRHGVSEEKKLELRLGPPQPDCSISFTQFLDPFNGGQAYHLQSPTAAALPNTSHKRTAPSPVVGWPPLRSFRKNHAGASSLKPISGSQNAVPNKLSGGKAMEGRQKGFFVKINMDGIPIGRKVDLNAYDSYEKLASAVDDLFRCLLAAQNEGCGCGNHKEDKTKAIVGLLDGSGEYTLVYEDNEGDTMLVGDDVHWRMFVSTVKRLRVLKSSELSTLSRGKQVKL